MNELSIIQRIAIWALPVIFAVTVHEVAHGWTANRLGDRTALMLGRVTLNPLKHIDPIGTLLIPAILLIMGGFVFGWAKPVPVTWENLRKPKRDMALVALAGPAVNFIMAVLWALVIKLGLMLDSVMPQLVEPLVYMGAAGVMINLVLMVLNLLPMPPLDGGRIVSSLLPGPLAWKYNQIERYGILILLLLLASGMLDYIMGPPISWLQTKLFLLSGI